MIRSSTRQVHRRVQRWLLNPFPFKHMLSHLTQWCGCDFFTYPRVTQEIPAIFTTKTGLGSSAALVSSLVAALFHYVGLMNSQQQRDLSHNVAQFCHCSAQGKVGSGFDVSAAFYGRSVIICFAPCSSCAVHTNPHPSCSQRYSRFAANLLSPLLEVSRSALISLYYTPNKRMCMHRPPLDRPPRLL